jgi:tRNA-dihydrouridine synthase
VIGIGGVAVETNIAPIAAQVDLPFRRPMARLAQTLQLASDEFSPVALMRRDVIDHVRRRHDSALQTELAQRMQYQLELAQPSPARGGGCASEGALHRGSARL